MTRTSPVADGVRARANVPPSGAQLNALDFALEQILRSNVSTAALNVTSSAALSSASPSATDSQNVSASTSASAASEVSLAASPSDVSSSLVASQSASAESAPVVSATVSASAQSFSSVSAWETAPSSRSASSSDGVLSAPRVAAVSSSSSLAAASPAPAPSSSTATSSTSAKESATFMANPAATSTAAPSSPEVSTSASEPHAAPAPEPSSESSSSVASESSTKAAAPTTPQAPSTNAATSQQGTQSSTLAPASSNNEVSPSETFNGPEVPSTNEASPRPGNTSISSVNQGGQGSSPTNASLRAGQPTPTGSTPNSATDLGNGLIGITSPSHVDSTLSTPEAVTVTSGSQTFVTTPPFITSISVSTGSNDIPVATFTSVFANPTNAPEVGRLANDRSFWDNKGAVAGVFAAMALVLLSTIFGAAVCCRRRRRRVANGFDNAQFRRFSSPPEMMQQPTTYQPVRERGFTADDPTRYLTAPSSASEHVNGQEDQRSGSQGLGLTGIPARPPGLTPPDYEGPFSDYHRYISTGDTRLGTPPGRPVGIAVTSDFEGKAEPFREATAQRRSPSPAPSSPSIYPPSLPTVKEKDEDDYLFYEQETTRRPESQSNLPTPPPKAVVKNDSNPQNPFSSPLEPVLDTGLKRRTSEPARIMTNTNSSYRPLTPPDSSAGHSPTTPQFSGAEESSTKPLNVSRYSNAFLGRSVSMRTEHLPRPPRNPLRMSTSGSSLRNDEEP